MTLGILLRQSVDCSVVEASTRKVKEGLLFVLDSFGPHSGSDSVEVQMFRNGAVG